MLNLTTLSSLGPLTTQELPYPVAAVNLIISTSPVAEGIAVAKEEDSKEENH